MSRKQLSLFALIGVGLLLSEQSVASGKPVHLNHLSVVQATTDFTTEEARRLFETGQRQLASAHYKEAIETFQKALEIYRKLNNQEAEASTLTSLGIAYDKQSQYQEAIRFYQQAVGILSGIQQPTNYGKVVLGNTLNNLGSAYYSLGDYSAALNAYQQSRTSHHKVGNLALENDTLSSIALTYSKLGQYSEALELYQRTLASSKRANDLLLEGRILNNIGTLYRWQKQYSKALYSFQAALKLRQQAGDTYGESYTLNGLGLVYTQLMQYAQAEAVLERSLKLAQQVYDRKSEGRTFDSLGDLYKELKQYPKALKAYQQALVIGREIGDRDAEYITLSNLGRLLRQQNQPELAITFYKQSVNTTEEIRKRLRVLSHDQQESYTKTIADTYRQLADLLLTQGRILEAQEVLELLKVQEIRDYTHETRGIVTTAGIQYTPVEQKILTEFNSLIAFGRKIAECERTSCAQKSQFNQRREALTDEYNQKMVEIVKEIRDRRSKDDAFFDPRNLGTSAQKIVEAQPNTLLIYPLVLNEKLWLLWVAPNGIVNRVEVPVSQKQLGDTVLKFRQLLGNPTSEVAQVQSTGKQLYQWLIQPLEKELTSNKVQTLIFSLDRVTRYIPMAALFDGKHYLIERYQVSTILSADLTNMSDRLPNGAQNTQVLAMGLSEAKAGFNALPNVPAELDEIVRTDTKDQSGVYPGAVLLNQAFTFRSLADGLLGHTIVHIATHGKFVSGSFDASYLLTGTGEALTIPQINTLSNLSKVQLVVLSACETGLGGPDAEGLEIAGLAYYFTVGDRAKAVLASLWSVNDTSTTQLMQQFYKNLATGKLTKAEALRQAQLTLMQVGNRASQQARGDSFKLPAINSSQAPISRDFSHPYYWAPFILIGNSL